MDNYFECIYTNLSGKCMLTWIFDNKKFKTCSSCYQRNNCEICHWNYHDKKYCKNCINKGVKYD